MLRREHLRAKANSHLRQAFEANNPNEHLAEADYQSHSISTNDLFIKDAFLVFRSLCKLTMKNLNTERYVFPRFNRMHQPHSLYSERDLKSHAMRSKLISLHLVLTILNSHMHVFVQPSSIIYSTSTDEATPFILATKQYLCLALSRNALSPVPQVFEISVEIFWRVLSGMRTKLKVSSHLQVCYEAIRQVRRKRSRSSSMRSSFLFWR